MKIDLNELVEAKATDGRLFTSQKLDMLDNESREAVETKLADTAWSEHRCAQLLTRNGFHISATAVRNWRRDNGITS